MIYFCRQLTPKKYEITGFDQDYRYECRGYTITNNNGNFICDCPGFRRQKNKDEHKHIILLKFWIENLDKEQGISMWFEGEDIEYCKVFDTSIEEFTKTLNKFEKLRKDKVIQKYNDANKARQEHDEAA